ncbi:hypothetical protein PHLGIDRAFT_80597, partial [Phlebiopsis gigantea 11061_1 CR5-6]
YVERLDVVFGNDENDMPTDCIHAISGQNSNIDFQAGGKFIWLVPIYTTDVARAATSFDVLIQSYEDPKLNDLARRAGGDFRYVVPRADRKLSDKIVEVGILRSDKPLGRPPPGWHGYCVNDLNKGRRKGCLYVVWKSASTGSWYVLYTII